MEIAAIIFILVMLAVAYMAFRILKKTLKMAFRAVIVLLILGIAIIGGLAIWNMDLASSIKPSTTKKKTLVCFNNAPQNKALL